MLLGVLSTSCTSADDGPRAVEEPVVADCSDIGDLLKLREELTADAGRRVTLRAIGADGEPVVADPASCLRTSSPGVEVAAVPATADDPAIAMLVDPGADDADAERSASVASGIVESLAPDVDLAVFGLGPADDGYSVPAVVSEAPSEWLVWNSTGPPPPGWGSDALLLGGGFGAQPTPIDRLPPELAAVPGPVLARSTLSLDEAVDPSGLRLSGEHTGGVVLRVSGEEVLRSNLPAGDLAADTRPIEVGRDRIEFSATIPAERLVGRDHVVSIEWFGAVDAAVPPYFDFTAIDRRERPISTVPLTGFSTDRAFAIEQIEGRPSRPLAPRDLESFVTGAASYLDEWRENSSDGPKVLVIVAPTRSPEDLPALAGDPLVVWVGQEGGSVRRGVHRAVDAGPDAGERIASYVAAHRNAGVWAVGVCGPAEPIEPVLEVADTAAKTSPKLDAALGSGPCDPSRAALGTPAQSTLRFELSEDQRRVAAQREDESDRRPFTASWPLAEGVSVPVELRVRGQSSLGCDRKSFSVSSPERVPIPLMDGWAPSEFNLLSLCLDDGYVRTLTTYRLLERLGLSDLRMALVEVEFGLQSRGVYLMVEHPDDLVEHGPTAAGVVRRRLDRSVQVSEVEWVANDRADLLLAEYDSVIDFAESYDGDDLAGELDRMMDLDGYLRWLALMSLLENGDYSDEVFFVGEPVARGADLGLRWHIQPWDPDDMFLPCHLDGVLEIDDLAGLTSCAESRIDVPLLADPGVVARLQTQVHEVLDEITPDVFEDVMRSVRAELDGALPDEPQTVMTELGTVDESVVDGATFAAALDRNQSELTARFDERHHDLDDTLLAQGGAQLDSDAVARLSLRSSDRATLGGPLPIVVEARSEDGTIDESISGLVEVHATGGSIESVPMVVRRGRGSVTAEVSAVDAGQLTLSLEGGPTTSVEVRSPDSPVRSVAGDLAGADLRWGPDETIRVTGTTRIAPGATLVIGSGTHIEVAPGVDVDVGGHVDGRGTSEHPVVFTAGASGGPWGGVRHDGSTGTYAHTWFVGGGANTDRVFGHSDSQPVLFATGGADLVLEHAVVQDGPGKGPSADSSTVSISDTLITRLDTGGEMVDSTVDISTSWYLDFPGPRRGDDDDNDALYLARSGPDAPGASVAEVRNSVFIFGGDDGIDHNGADVELVGLWIEGFEHECVAFSAGGTARLADSVATGCQQGIEVGYGEPSVALDHVVALDNDVGVRFGDEYDVAASGSIVVENSIVADNRDDVRNFVPQIDGPAPRALVLRTTLIGAPDDADGDVLTGSVSFTKGFLLGPVSAGIGAAEDGSDVGLSTGRPGR